MSDTIFSKIVRREIPADIVFENDTVLAFRDLNPQAPVHVLFIPKEPIATLNDVVPEQAELAGQLMIAAADYAKQEGFAEDGVGDVVGREAHPADLEPHLAVGERIQRRLDHT